MFIIDDTKEQYSLEAIANALYCMEYIHNHNRCNITQLLKMKVDKTYIPFSVGADITVAEYCLYNG